MAKISNRQARSYVENKQEFITHNGTMYGTHDLAANTYTVYSYGDHFPMYVYDYTAEMWVGNVDKYSPTTSKHQSAARPSNVALWVNTAELINVSHLGLAHSVVHRMAA